MTRGPAGAPYLSTSVRLTATISTRMRSLTSMASCAAIGIVCKDVPREAGDVRNEIVEVGLDLPAAAFEELGLAWSPP